MATKTSTTTKSNKRKSKEKEEKVNARDILSFSSAVIAVVASAIFYIAGWYYLAHWYAFYGIDVSQINLPTQLVIIHGVPSVLILTVAGILSASIIAIWKMLSRAERLSVNDIPTIVIMAYGIAFVTLLVTTLFFAVVAQPMAIPKEVIWALVISLILAIVISVLYQFSILITKEEVPFSGNFGLMFIKPARIYAILRLLPNALLEFDIRRVVQLLFFTPVLRIQSSSGVSIDFTDKNSSTLLEKDLTLQEIQFTKLIEHQNKYLPGAITETWQFWVGSVLVLYFLVSISTSALLGDWDAMRSGRFMIGDWRVPEISLYSKSTLPALEKFETKLNSGYEYKSLGLLSSDDKVYYLVEWKTSDYYQQKPKVYIIPRNDDLMLNFIVSPYVAPTATPVPINTKIPTVTPTVTVSVTATPTP